jgi:hypothetical protein
MPDNNNLPDGQPPFQPLNNDVNDDSKFAVESPNLSSNQLNVEPVVGQPELNPSTPNTEPTIRPYVGAAGQSSGSVPIAPYTATTSELPGSQINPDSFKMSGALPQVPPKKNKKKLWLAICAVMVLLILSAGYVLAFYLPSTPANIYDAALSNTGKAVDQLINYTSAQRQADYKSLAFNGKLTVKSAGSSYDMTLDGAGSKGNAQIQATGDYMGETVNANVRVVTVSGNSSPDVYIKISGVAKMLNAYGLTSLAGLDSKWIAIDHTLIDSYKSSLSQSLNAATGGVTNSPVAPTYSQIMDAVYKVQAVNKQYLFTTDSSKSVLSGETFVGKETLNGQTMNHYNVGYNKAHLEAYVTAVGHALDTSQLNDWSVKTNNGKNLSQSMQLNTIIESIKNADAAYTFDLWINTKTKLISMLAFTNQKDKSQVFTIGQNYTGGSNYPFNIAFKSKDSSGNPQSGTLAVTLDTNTNKVNVNLKVQDQTSSGSTAIVMAMDFAPGKNPITVTAPVGAIPLLNVLSSIGLGGILPPSGSKNTPANVNPACSNPALLLQCSPAITGTGSGVNPGGLMLPACKPIATTACPLENKT